MKKIAVLIFAFTVFLWSCGSTTTSSSAAPLSDPIEISVNLTDTTGVGKNIGSVRAENTEYGLLLAPNLTDLSAGIHGFHVHEKPDCGPASKDGNIVPGLAAGGHYDPEGTGKHEGPYSKNAHLGDLPPLIVAEDGTATLPLLAPRVKVADLGGRSLTIHAGGDNYSDTPKALGGGGARVACGVIAASAN
ncbi:MAG: superoxide dismutase [Cu-Zn] SodC [Geitlerinemataceae cyanobacterium]